MGKSHRHKKLNRQEKAKTQLKGAKKLAKAANVVNPTLRVKRIVIREQLNSSAATPHSSTGLGGGSGGNVDIALTRRHQTLPELLSALHHHNTNLRKDALLGLHELVTGIHNHNTTFLKRNLDKILERVAALTSDLESVVRRENLKVAEAIFSRVEEPEVSPFWALLLTHLQCTLTHLNPTVRYSTLPFFHLLVTHFPNLVAGSARTLLTSFLGLISSSDPNSSGNNNNTTTAHLKVEISGQKDQVLERLKVFALIDATLQLRTRRGVAHAQVLAIPRQLCFLGEVDHKVSRTENLLTAVIDNLEEQQQQQQNNNNEEIVIFSSLENRNNNKNIKNNRNGEAGLIYPFGYDSLFNSRNSQSSSMSLGEILGGGFRSSLSSSSSDDDENKFWPKFASSCLSCLTETWIESCPTASGSSMALGMGSSSTSASTTLEPRKNTKTKERGGNGKIDKKGGSLAKSLSSQQPPSSTSSTATTSVNLNPASVDILKNLVSVMVQIITPSARSSSSSAEVNAESSGMDDDGKSSGATNELLKVIRESRGSELRKHFFSHLPYVSIQESQKRGLTTINLELFLFAAQLGLMDRNLMTRLETLIDELIQGGSLDSEQCELILRFFSCGDPFLAEISGGSKKRGGPQKKEQQQRNQCLSTDFILCVLSSRDHRREICKYLQKVLRPENTNLEEMFLIQSLDWERVTSKLVSTFSHLSLKWLNLLTHIAIRGLCSSGIKSLLVQRIEWFQVELEATSSLAVWMESIRLFWYAGALPEFKEVFGRKLPQNCNSILCEMMSTLEECQSMSESSNNDIEMAR